jgi:hypothetical protein
MVKARDGQQREHARFEVRGALGDHQALVDRPLPVPA